MQAISWKIRARFFTAFLCCVPNFKVQGNFLNENFYETYTANTPLTFLEESLFATRLKDVVIIEDCDVIFIATSILKVMLAKIWDATDWKIKVSKKFTKSGKLRRTIFNWYFTNATWSTF